MKVVEKEYYPCTEIILNDLVKVKKVKDPKSKKAQRRRR